MAELNTLRAVKERLRPVRKFMDDFDLAVQGLGEVEGQVADRKTEVGHLEAQVVGLKDTIADLETLLTESREALEREKVRLAATQHRMQAEHTVFMEGLEHERKAARDDADRQRSVIQDELAAFVELTQEQKRTTQVEYDRLKEATDALKGELKGLLR